MRLSAMRGLQSRPGAVPARPAAAPRPGAGARGHHCPLGSLPRRGPRAPRAVPVSPRGGEDKRASPSVLSSHHEGMEVRPRRARRARRRRRRRRPPAAARPRDPSRAPAAPAGRPHRRGAVPQDPERQPRRDCDPHVPRRHRARPAHGGLGAGGGGSGAAPAGRSGRLQAGRRRGANPLPPPNPAPTPPFPPPARWPSTRPPTSCSPTATTPTRPTVSCLEGPGAGGGCTVSRLGARGGGPGPGT
jgi:hypothetical protein